MSTDQGAVPKIEKVADGLYVRQAVDNITWIDMGEWALVVDALEQADLEREVMDAIRDTLGKKTVRYLINTHTHGDHVALNRAFQKRHKAEVVNLRTAAIPLEGRWFEGTRRRAQMLSMAGCHSDTDAIVWVPEDRALLSGDLFGWGLIPHEVGLDDASARMVLDVYRRLIEFDAVTVIPGHGPLCTTAELRRWTEYFRWLVAEVARLCAAGKTDEAVAEALPAPADMAGWWRFVQWKHADSLKKVLAAVRAGRLSGE